MGRFIKKDVLLGGVPVSFLPCQSTIKKTRVQERFEKEAKTCALLGQKSIHIVRVMDYGVMKTAPHSTSWELQGEPSDIICLNSIPLRS